MALLAGDHALLVATALPVCSRYGLAITGGYAMKAHGLVDRPSDDIDFATASAAPMEEIADALAVAYREAGCPARVRNTGSRFGHLDALDDVVALKVGALHDRGVVRDLIDIHAASSHFSAADLVVMGRAVLDAEFRLESLRDQLDRAQMYPDEEFAAYGLDPVQSAEVRAWAVAWSARLSMEMAEDEPWSEEEWTDE